MLPGWGVVLSPSKGLEGQVTYYSLTVHQESSVVERRGSIAKKQGR